MFNVKDVCHVFLLGGQIQTIQFFYLNNTNNGKSSQLQMIQPVKFKVIYDEIS